MGMCIEGILLSTSQGDTILACLALRNRSSDGYVSIVTPLMDSDTGLLE